MLSYDHITHTVVCYEDKRICYEDAICCSPCDSCIIYLFTWMMVTWATWTAVLMVYSRCTYQDQPERIWLDTCSNG